MKGKLLFNTATRSIVLYYKGKYYDMRNGNQMELEGKLPAMKPYDKYTMSKPEELKAPDTLSLASFPIEVIKEEGLVQFGGNFPRYFWKGFVKLIQSNTIDLNS